VNSCLYEGAVLHRRFEVQRHEFRYRLTLAYMDLDELPALLGGRLVAARPGLVRFRRRDYLGGDSSHGLADAVRGAVAAHAGRRPDGPVRLLTQLRSWGHCFNPVSFYYCFDQSGEHLEHVLAEVTNTPWGERRSYVLSASSDEPGPLLGQSAKELHVSPFMAMDYTYWWHVSVPSERLEVHIESVRGEARAFDATMCLRRRELSDANMRRMALRYPLANMRVLALIYGHAVALKLKGVPVHPHPKAGVV
jgi:uncharacterized protein